jgi:hypothetical protein
VANIPLAPPHANDSGVQSLNSSINESTAETDEQVREPPPPVVETAKSVAPRRKEQSSMQALFQQQQQQQQQQQLIMTAEEEEPVDLSCLTYVKSSNVPSVFSY